MTRSAKRTDSIARKPACRNPLDASESDAADDAWVKRCRVLFVARELQSAEKLARSIGAEGIARRRLEFAREDLKFQSFLTAVLE
jgi:hypothetical protein